MQSPDRNSESHQRVATANPTDGRTDGRTSEVGNLANRLKSATRAHVQAFDESDGQIEPAPGPGEAAYRLARAELASRNDPTTRRATEEGDQ